MRILIVADPPAKLNPLGDSSFFLARAARAAGHDVDWCEASDLSLRNQKVFVKARTIESAAPKKRIVLGKPRPAEPATNYQSIWIRKDPPFDASYLSLCWMLSLIEDEVLLVNRPSLLLQHHEKLLPLQAMQVGFLSEKDILPTFVSAHGAEARPEEFPTGALVEKPWLGFGGRSVKKLTRPPARKRETKAKLRSGKVEFQIYQPFLANVTEVGDRRVLFIGGEYAGDFVRLPKKGSFVANLAQGGHGVLRELFPEEKELCRRIGLFLKQAGIQFAGVDLLGPYVTEMNITSPTGLQTLVDLGGADLGARFLSMVEANLIR